MRKNRAMAATKPLGARLRRDRHGKNVGLAPLGLADDPVDRQRGHHADRADRIEGHAPVERGGQRGAECDAQRRADRRTEVEDRHRGCPSLARKGVRDDRIGGRDAARLADADHHACDDQLAVTAGHPACRRRAAPDRTGGGEDLHSAGTIGQPADRDCDEAIEEREIETGEQTELAVGNMQPVLDRLGEDRDELAIEEVQHIDEAQHRERDPGARRGLVAIVRCGGGVHGRHRPRSRGPLASDIASFLSSASFFSVLAQPAGPPPPAP